MEWSVRLAPLRTAGHRRKIFQENANEQSRKINVNPAPWTPDGANRNFEALKSVARRS